MRDQMHVRHNAVGPSNDPQERVPAAFQMSSARSRSGAISVVTTPQGLPTHIRIERSQLEKRPDLLADEILRLCRQSAMAAGIRWRDELLEAGATRDVVDALGLPTTDDLSRAEQFDDEHDVTPASWLRRV